jgi:hypothetical protein
MRRLLFLLTFSVLLNACKKDYDKIKSPYTFIPSEINSVIVINELNDFINSLENNAIISDLYNKELSKASIVLKNLNTTSPIYLSFLNEVNSDYLILTKNDSTLFIIDSIPNHSSESLIDYKINKISIDSSIVYTKKLGNIFAGSNNLDLIKKLDTKNEVIEISNLIETTNRQSVASLIFKPDTADFSKLLLSKNTTDLTLNKYTALDINYTSKNVSYNGILTASDSVQFKIDCFKNTIPQKTNSIDIAPYNTESLISITYNDFAIFDKNRRTLNNEDLDSTQTFLNFTDEIALIDDALILHTLDPELVSESIEDKSITETYKSIDIYENLNSTFFETRLVPFVTFKDANFFAVYTDFIIFSNTIDNLRQIITNALNNNALSKTAAFKNIQEKLSDEASLFIFKNSEGLSKVLDQDLTGYNANAVQFIYENNYAHVNGIIQKFKKRASSNTIAEAFTVTLEKDILSAPQTIKNHITKTHDIVVQDIDNVLYLISSSGQVLWKKQLQGEVLGKVEQIDTYKNGRLQLAFTTSNRLYLLDRNGKDVNNFPLKFNDQITQPLSVFDYDKRRNYRLLVTQDKNLLMYDAKGKSINGFKYNNTDSRIITQPKHFRIGSKDYIAFATGENLKILNRQGNVRVKINDKISFSNNELYLYKNKFTTTNNLGQLVQVDTKGNLSLTNLNLPENHSIATTSKTLVSLTENKLNIKSRTVDLDYGEYTAPKIFYINDKIYITTTDLQSKKVYLFDSQAKQIANFPVFGTSSAELQKLDNEKGLELITQVDSKTVTVYKLY